VASRIVEDDLAVLSKRLGLRAKVPGASAEAVREDDLAVLDLQRAPGDLYSVEDVEAPGPAGMLPVRVYRPRPGRLHPVLFLHGGGFVIGRDGYDAPLRELALASGCMIVVPECRLAPEHPFPAAADDALAAARWLNAEAAALGASDTSPAVAGDSSGGNLAATVTHALTREGAPPSFQVLIYPMLDARTGTPDAPFENPTVGEFVWTRAINRFAWRALRGTAAVPQEREGHFSPSLASDLETLPPTFLAVGSLDLFLEEDVDYAMRLSRAGVPVELHVYQGGVHGFDLFPGNTTDRFSSDLHTALARFLRKDSTT
jgi:triacylglycerol lipase